MSHSFVFDNKDDPILHSIAQELHTSLNQQPTTTNESDPSSTTTGSASLHAYEFRLESFLTRPRTCTTLFPPRVQKSRYSHILVQERLVLLSAGPSSSPADGQGTDTDKDEKKNEAATTQVLIAGLEVLEYTLTPLSSPPSSSPSAGNKDPQARKERIIYIAKVDTSGFWPLPGLESVSLKGKSPAQALVKGYLRSVRATSHGLSSLTDITVTVTKDNSSSSSETTSSTAAAAAAAAAGKMSALSITPTPTTARRCRPRKTSLYIFARAQPQYLFANSAKNPQKRVLDDRGLVRWWKNTAASVYAESMDPSTTTTTTTTQVHEQEAEGKRIGDRKTNVQGWWHIPGIETERQANNVIQSTTATTNNSKAFEWIYGYPDKDSKELANALIPQFPDDPKSRMMQSPSCQGGFVNIRTFWELAAIGEESGAGKITGFFRVVEDDEGEDEGEGEEGEEGEEVQEKAVTGTTSGYTKVINFLLDLEFSTMEDARRSTRTWQDRVEVWVRKSVEKEAERVLEVEVARRQEQGKKDGKEEEVKEKKREAVAAVRSLWIQKGSVEVLLRHGSDVPPTPSPASTTQEPTTTTAVPTPAATPAVVNTLSIGLIKRKAPTPASTTTTTAITTTPASTTASPAVNVLGAGLIKRKVTPVTTSNNTPAPAPAAPMVNVLGAGLIKRKVAPTSTTPATTTTMPETSSTAPVVNVLGASFIKKRKTDS
ncbi:hypothetical protein EC957_002040 [Mortierella hygrophila]|uniref:histone acetyltransferase n=1 Tax=Mortierella hygrophila TaxID=979708 RepID=A0A9P6FFA8_9FUNG|nr:hypothetical protein EC957_002040 [Mortierella hygrophila]